jgi:hypothetical protein
VNRRLAHSLRDELPPPRPAIVRDTWHDHARDAAEIVAGVLILGALFVGILLVLFLAGGA